MARTTTPGRPRAGRAAQRGFTLLEALIALLVLSVGLLGLAALQARGLAYNHDAFVRSQATLLAYDMIERMRMHAVNRGLSEVARYVEAGGQDSADRCDDAAWQSTDVTLEVACWKRAVERRLPNGTATIAAGTSASEYVITLTWNDRTVGQKGEPDEAGDTLKVQTWSVQL